VSGGLKKWKGAGVHPRKLTKLIIISQKERKIGGVKRLIEMGTFVKTRKRG